MIYDIRASKYHPEVKRSGHLAAAPLFLRRIRHRCKKGLNKNKKNVKYAKKRDKNKKNVYKRNKKRYLFLV